MIKTFDKAISCTHRTGEKTGWKCSVEGYKPFVADQLDISRFCSIYADDYNIGLHITPETTIGSKPKPMVCALLEDKNGTTMICTYTKEMLESDIKSRKKTYPETKQLEFEHD